MRLQFGGLLATEALKTLLHGFIFSAKMKKVKMCISHFRQLGNQKETLMVEIPTVASPSRLFGVLYQQHLSKIF